MSRWVLEVIEGPAAGHRIAVDDPVELGRASRTGGRLEHEQISRRHALVEPMRNGVRITDLNSTNGTHISGHPISGSRILRSGDTVRLGVTVLRLARGEELAGAPARVRLRPDHPEAGGLHQPAGAGELAAADVEAQEEAIVRAQELKLTVVGAGTPPGAILPGAPALRGPLSRIVDAQVARQARHAAAILLGTSSLSVVLYYVLR